jgi:hypothetical protein
VAGMADAAVLPDNLRVLESIAGLVGLASCEDAGVYCQGAVAVVQNHQGESVDKDETAVVPRNTLVVT